MKMGSYSMSMLKKSKMAALGLSLLLTSFAGAASAAMSSYYNPVYDFYGNPTNDCASGDMWGYKYPSGYTWFSVYGLSDGQATTVSGKTIWGNVVATGQFSCSQGYIYYDEGPTYELYDWYGS
jgi:hypothetical protein